MADDLGALHDVIEQLSSLDPMALDDAQLHAVVVAVQRERARLGAVAGSLLGAWDARRVWAGDGSRSAAARLSRDTACAPVSAAVELRRARQLRSLPATAMAVRGGELSLDHIDLLGRANRPHRAGRFADDEAVLVRECTRLRFRDATRMVGYWCSRADAESGEPDGGRDPACDNHLHASPTLRGSVVINGLLDPLGGTVVLGELRRLERELFLSDERDGITRTAAERRATALVVMAQRSASTPADARAPRPLFTVLLGDDTFRDLCELADSTVVRPRHLRSWWDAADMETILFDGPSTVVSVSRRRSFTGAVRRAVEVRDRRCQHPSGCDLPADRCDVDHIVPFADGGVTSQFNGRLECPTHNRHTDRHDYGAIPRPARPLDRLDELRARLRWRARLEEHEETRRPSPMST